MRKKLTDEEKKVNKAWRIAYEVANHLLTIDNDVCEIAEQVYKELMAQGMYTPAVTVSLANLSSLGRKVALKNFELSSAPFIKGGSDIPDIHRKGKHGRNYGDIELG